MWEVTISIANTDAKREQCSFDYLEGMARAIVKDEFNVLVGPTEIGEGNRISRNSWSIHTEVRLTRRGSDDPLTRYIEEHHA